MPAGTSVTRGLLLYNTYSHFVGFTAEGIVAVTEDKDASIYVYCRSGRRSGIAKETLEGLGFTQVVNVGGIEQAMKKFDEESTGETTQ